MSAEPKNVSEARTLALCGDAMRQAAESISTAAKVIRQFSAKPRKQVKGKRVINGFKS